MQYSKYTQYPMHVQIMQKVGMDGFTSKLYRSKRYYRNYIVQSFPLFYPCLQYDVRLGDDEFHIHFYSQETLMGHDVFVQL